MCQQPRGRRNADKGLSDGLERTSGELSGFYGTVDIFYVDCFKGLSRNFEKVLHVLQIILQSEKAFVTCNYYISDGRIEKRRRILRAFHCQKDMFDNVRNLNGLPAFFKSVLREMV